MVAEMKIKFTRFKSKYIDNISLRIGGFDFETKHHAGWIFLDLYVYDWSLGIAFVTHGFNQRRIFIKLLPMVCIVIAFEKKNEKIYSKKDD